MNILGQTQYQPVPLWKQIILLYAIHHRYIRVMNDVTILMNRINEFSHSADLIIKNNTATLQMLMEMVYGTNAKN